MLQGKQPKRILVVDDSKDAAESFARVLEGMGHDSVWITDPRLALQTADEFRPDIVFLDIGMPHISGWELAQMFRSQVRFRGLRIVAVTAYGAPEDHKRSREAGFDAHVLKPIDPALVDSVLETVLPESAGVRDDGVRRRSK